MPDFILAYLLIPFGLVFLLASLFFFFNIFHINRYAIRSKATTLLILTYLGSYGLLVAIIAGYLVTVDWSQDFQPADLMPSFESSSRLD